jgi:hypothetical protein
MTNRPPSISVKEIASAVDKAVKIASKKHNVKFADEFTIDPGLLMGRWLLEDIKISQAEIIAEEITQGTVAALSTEAKTRVLKSPESLQPGIFGTGGHVICGFIWRPPFSVGE